jgi:hypothetical protein
MISHLECTLHSCHFTQRRRNYTDRLCETLSAGLNPSFIASQIRHENAKIVHEVYSKWIAGMNVHRVVTLSDRLQTLLPHYALRLKRYWIMSFKISRIATSYLIP